MMLPLGKGKILVQCDFDGTVTEEDISFLILDTFADGNWRQLLAQYREKRISVGCFNTRAFTMIKEDELTLKKFVKERFELRAGFRELIEYCRGKGFRFVIVSNGLDFYIRTILETVGLDDIEVFAARARFCTDGVETRYIGPGGNELQDDFKEAYIRYFLNKGYRIAYVGNGDSDIPSARLAHHVFATGQLLEYYKARNLGCTPFTDLNDVVKELELLGR
jgi:2-hydroxy-3-keto-5-methylthiopentenyl-1-phosphate phosphatase